MFVRLFSVACASSAARSETARWICVGLHVQRCTVHYYLQDIRDMSNERYVCVGDERILKAKGARASYELLYGLVRRRAAS